VFLQQIHSKTITPMYSGLSTSLITVYKSKWTEYNSQNLKHLQQQRRT